MRDSHESRTLQISSAVAVVITIIGIATVVDATRVAIRVRVIGTQYIQRIRFWRQIF